MRVFTVVSAVLALAAGVVAGVSAAPARAGQATACREYHVPVTVPAPGSYISGELCAPAGASAVMVLVPGATYDSAYWNFPYDPSVYNFRLAMNTAGYATMTVDLLGTGQSSRPLSTTLTAEDEGTAVHEVIQDLRSGRVGDRSFPSVVIGGHSVGSAVSLYEVATYRDVNGVLLTGFSHHWNYARAASDILTSFYPADLDPKFAGEGLDPGYLTTRPGTRGQDFDAPATPAPGVVAADEATKAPVPSTIVPDSVVQFALPLTKALNVPVLVANGQDDPLVCGAGTDCSTAASLANDEAPYYPRAAQLQTYVLPGSGHDVNLAPNTRLYQRSVLSWLAIVCRR